MVDKKYQIALKEVNDVLENTEEILVNKIPRKVIEFIKKYMDSSYENKIEEGKELKRQNLLPETEAILSLLYRSYWATEEEKIEIIKRDKIELEKEQERQNIEKILENKRNQKKDINIEKQLMIIEKKSLLTKILDKIKTIFKKKSKS